jgi:hypothetical protein
MKTSRLSLSLGIIFCAALEARAQDGETCDVAAPLDAQRLLRRMSLDLRGEVPSYDEAVAQRGKADVEVSKVDEYLNSPEFIRSMRKFHEAALWPNIDQIQIIPDTHILFPYELAPGEPVYMSALRSVFTRPAAGGPLYYPCKNEPAEFDIDGNIISEPVMMGDAVIAYQEGWVEVEPYWAPGTTIHVCGYDAASPATATLCPGPLERYPFGDPFCEQLAATAAATGIPAIRGSQAACDGPLAIFAPECGCGPNLELCHTYETVALLRQSLLDQQMRVIDQVIAADRPYEDILLEPAVETNGPLAHYLTKQTGLTFDLYGAEHESAPIPANIPYSDVDTWHSVTRSGRHSGILTTPGYLLRFQSNRQRAHRFYNVFECSSFIPNGPLPSPFEACSKHEDLTKRCGCDACHQGLEPMAAHWGRFAEYGFAPIDDEIYPKVLGPSCTQPFNSIEQLFRCVRFYEIDPVGEELEFAYNLNAYVFRRGEDLQNIEIGPRKLAQTSIESGRFASCTARKMWTHLMRRAPTTDEETSVLPDIIDAYEAGGNTLRSMVKAIVTHPAYRRLP